MLRRLMFTIGALTLVFALAVATAGSAVAAGQSDTLASAQYAPVTQGDDDDDDDNGAVTLPDTGVADHLSVLLGMGVMVIAGGLILRRRFA